MESVSVPLSVTEPFSFQQTLAFIRAFYARDYERVPAHAQVQGDRLRRVVSVLEKPIVFELEERKDALTLTLHAEQLDDDLIAAATDHVRFYLGLDDDLHPLYSRADPVFSELVRSLYGYHMLRVLTPFEAACWALIQQRTPNGFAHKTMAKLCEHFGKSLTVGGVRHTAFPEARQMLHDPQARVLDATNNTRKTERLLYLIRAFATADETFLRQGPYGDVARWIGGIKGLGAWSVDFIMLRGLGRAEHVPWTDTAMLEAISSVYTQGFEISTGAARELAERYGTHQGYWAHYLKVAAYGPTLREDATLKLDEYPVG